MNSATVAVSDVATASQYNNLRRDALEMAGGYATTTGSANAYILTIDSQISAYVTGMLIRFKANFANTGIVTINVNGLGAKSVYKGADGTQELSPSDIPNGSLQIAQYDGAAFQLLTVQTTPSGVTVPFAGATAPTGWTICDGSSLSKTAYQTLHKVANFQYGEGAINTKLTRTFTAVAATNVCTSTGHTLNNDVPVVLTSTGTLPAGLSTATIYWIVQEATNVFKLSATRGGTEIDITGTGSGTHTWTQWMEADATTDTLYTEAHGLLLNDLVSFSSTGSLPTGLTALINYYVINPTADNFQVSTSLGGAAVDITAVGTVNGSSYIKNFLVPNTKQRVVVGKDSGTFATQGATGGEETHALSTAELASHAHTIAARTGGSAVANVNAGYNTGSMTPSTNNAGSGTAHNNLQPYIVLPSIIKN